MCDVRRNRAAGGPSPASDDDSRAEVRAKGTNRECRSQEHPEDVGRCPQMSADVELPHAAARQRRYKAKMRAVLPATLVLLVACASAKPERQGDGYARVTWPQASPVIEYPRVVIHGDGRRTVEDTVPPASLQPLNVAAEAAFHAGDCPKAEERYREILAQSSTFYPALLGLGDCALRGRRAREAIDHYREARRINPDDFLSYFSEADARAKLGNLAEAHELLTQALVLRPVGLLRRAVTAAPPTCRRTRAHVRGAPRARAARTPARRRASRLPRTIRRAWARTRAARRLCHRSTRKLIRRQAVNWRQCSTATGWVPAERH